VQKYLFFVKNNIQLLWSVAPNPKIRRRQSGNGANFSQSGSANKACVAGGRTGELSFPAPFSFVRFGEQKK
jgi:hypothetical protein